MNFGRKNVYFFDFREEAEIDADAEIFQHVSFMKPACRASSRLM